MAIASFRRLRPSRIRARKNSVRRSCFTVRGPGANIEPARNLFVCCSPARASSRPARRGGHIYLIQVDHGCPPTHSTIAPEYPIARLSPTLRTFCFPQLSLLGCSTSSGKSSFSCGLQEARGRLTSSKSVQHVAHDESCASHFRSRFVLVATRCRSPAPSLGRDSLP
jgi:hypothetical protein